MLIALLATLDAHAGRAIEATYLFMPEGTTLGGAEQAALGGLAFTGNSSGGRMTVHTELRGLFGAGMPKQGFAWDSELLLGMRYWPAGSLGFGLDTGFGGSAIGDALPRGLRVPLEARLTLAPGRFVLEPYFRMDAILGADNARQDGATLIPVGDELRYGVDLSYVFGAGRFNTLTVGYRRTEQLGVKTNGVLLQIWLGDKAEDDEAYYEDYNEYGEEQTGEELTQEETDAMIAALDAMMNPTSDAPVLTGDPFCDAINNIYAAAPGDFASVRADERPPGELAMGKVWNSTVQIPGLAEPASIYEGSFGTTGAWVEVIIDTRDANEARAAHDAFVTQLSACSFSRVMVTDAGELENVRYNNWIPFVGETDPYYGWIMEVQTSKLPDIEDNAGTISVVDSYNVIFRVNQP